MIKLETKEKKKLVAQAIKDFDYSVFGEWASTIKMYSAVLRKAILMSSDEQFEEFLKKLAEYEKIIFDILDGKPVELYLDKKEKEYFEQALTLLKSIPTERRVKLKEFINKILNVLR